VLVLSALESCFSSTHTELFENPVNSGHSGRTSIDKALLTFSGYLLKGMYEVKDCKACASFLVVAK